MVLRFLTSQKPLITVSIKLLAGFDKLDNYDPEKGFEVEITEGAKLKQAIKLVDIPEKNAISYIINGNKAGMNTRLKDGDEIFCFFPMAGG